MQRLLVLLILHTNQLAVPLNNFSVSSFPPISLPVQLSEGKTGSDDCGASVQDGLCSVEYHCTSCEPSCGQDFFILHVMLDHLLYPIPPILKPLICSILRTSIPLFNQRLLIVSRAYHLHNSICIQSLSQTLLYFASAGPTKPGLWNLDAMVPTQRSESNGFIFLAPTSISPPHLQREP